MMKYLEKLNPRERKIAVFCTVAGGLMVIYFLIAEPIMLKAGQIHSRRKQQQENLSMLLAEEGSVEAMKLKNLTAAVPVLEMPVEADKQVQLLRDQLTKQIQQAGIQVKNFQFQTGSATGPNASSLIMLQCRGRCQFPAIVKLLEELKKNPYYVGVEELTLRVDERNRQEMDFTFTVSTFRGSSKAL
ncbi:MAG: GspMb/PilO family protein [Anaerohalosphaeraceae bacterium]